MRWPGRVRLLALLALAACGRDSSIVRVGIAVEPGWYPAVRLAQAELEDLPIQWFADSTSNVQVAASALDYAEWLASQRVAVIVGHSSSRGSVAASTVYGPRGIVQVAPVATTRKLNSPSGRTFGLVPDDSVEGAYIAAFVDTALHARRVAVLYHQDEFGIGIRDGVVGELDRRGIATVDERYFSPEGAVGVSVDVSVLLAAALRSAPDAIILGARIAETREVAAYLRGHSLKIPVVCSDGSYVLPPHQEERNLSDLEGFYIVRFWSPSRDSSASEFAERFRRRFGYVPDQSDAFTYDAVKLVGAAVREGARSPAGFSRAFGSTGLKGRSYAGVAGRYQFVNGRPREVRAEMTVVRGGVLQPVGAAEPP